MTDLVLTLERDLALVLATTLDKLNATSRLEDDTAQQALWNLEASFDALEENFSEAWVELVREHRARFFTRLRPSTPLGPGFSSFDLDNELAREFPEVGQELLRARLATHAPAACPHLREGALFDVYFVDDEPALGSVATALDKLVEFTFHARGIGVRHCESLGAGLARLFALLSSVVRSTDHDVRKETDDAELWVRAWPTMISLGGRGAPGITVTRADLAAELSKTLEALVALAPEPSRSEFAAAIDLGAWRTLLAVLGRSADAPSPFVGPWSEPIELVLARDEALVLSDTLQRMKATAPLGDLIGQMAFDTLEARLRAALGAG